MTERMPEALPLVFHGDASLYKDDVKCIYNNDSFTELLNEDYDSFVMNPWAWKENDSLKSLSLVVPFIAAVTLSANVVAVATFVREGMISPLNTVLIAMAVSDTLTVLVPSVAIVYLYVDNIIPDFIPFEYCRLWGYLSKYLPIITHNASIWLALLLAYERYLIVCRPFVARRHCTHRNSLLGILMVYVLAALSHACRFVDTDYVRVKIVSANTMDLQENAMNVSVSTKSDLCNSSKGFFTCRAVYSDWLEGHGQWYEFVYYWYVILFVKFIPCTFLIIFDSLMLRGLTKGENFRFNLYYNCSKRQYDMKSRHHESRRVTLIIVGIIIAVVIVELPVGIILVFWTLSTIHGRSLVGERILSQTSSIANFLIYVSYPAIFMTYCCLCAKFRRALCHVVRCGRAGPQGDRIRNSSASSDVESGVMMS